MGNRKMRDSKPTEMSKPGEILYRAFIDELRFAKQQQWQISYYALLLLGGVLALARALPSQKPVWCILILLLLGTSLFLILHLQCYIRETRCRQNAMEGSFTAADRRIVAPPTQPPTTLIGRLKDQYEAVCVVLALGLIVSAIITLCIISALPLCP
jgi:hypothetical protein